MSAPQNAIQIKDILTQKQSMDSSSLILISYPQELRQPQNLQIPNTEFFTKPTARMSTESTNQGPVNNPKVGTLGIYKDP